MAWDGTLKWFHSLAFLNLRSVIRHTIVQSYKEPTTQWLEVSKVLHAQITKYLLLLLLKFHVQPIDYIPSSYRQNFEVFLKDNKKNSTISAIVYYSTSKRGFHYRLFLIPWFTSQLFYNIHLNFTLYKGLISSVKFSSSKFKSLLCRWVSLLYHALILIKTSLTKFRKGVFRGYQVDFYQWNICLD